MKNKITRFENIIERFEIVLVLLFLITIVIAVSFIAFLFILEWLGFNLDFYLQIFENLFKYVILPIDILVLLVFVIVVLLHLLLTLLKILFERCKNFKLKNKNGSRK